jgi:hypothetical protein
MVITTLQKWMMGLLGLGALALIVTNPQGFYSATSGLRNLIGGTESDILKAGKK